MNDGIKMKTLGFHLDVVVGSEQETRCCWFEGSELHHEAAGRVKTGMKLHVTAFPIQSTWCV